MERHQTLRRQAARITRVATRFLQGRLDLTDPLFNLREIAKHLILLEDHLVHPRKRCLDCIQKHLLTVEALAEEATALDQTGVYREFAEKLAALVRTWEVGVVNECQAPTLAQEVRALRKALAPLVFDPRGIVARVAEIHHHQAALCEHGLGAAGARSDRVGGWVHVRGVLHIG